MKAAPLNIKPLTLVFFCTSACLAACGEENFVEFDSRNEVDDMEVLGEDRLLLARGFAGLELYEIRADGMPERIAVYDAVAPLRLAVIDHRTIVVAGNELSLFRIEGTSFSRIAVLDDVFIDQDIVVSPEGRWLYVLGPTLDVYDIQDPSDPILVDEVDYQPDGAFFSGRSIAIDGDSLWITGFGSGDEGDVFELWLLDVARGDAPSAVEQITLDAHQSFTFTPMPLYATGSVVYAGVHEGFVRVEQANDSLKLSPVFPNPVPWDLAGASQGILIADNDGAVSYEWGTGEAKQRQRYATEGWAARVVELGPFVYVATNSRCGGAVFTKCSAKGGIYRFGR